MAIDYTLNWSDDGLKAPFTLIGGTVDTSSSSLALTGKGYVNWGERLQENLLHLLEHFASGGSAPAQPTMGQIWYNDVAKQLSVYHSGAWHVISSEGTVASLGGGFYHIPNDLVVNAYTMAPSTLTQFTCPRTGYISVAASCGFTPVTDTPVVNPLIGGIILDIFKNTTCVANGGMNGSQVAWGSRGPISTAMNVLNPYLQVNSGDVIRVDCVIAMVNSVSDYKTATSPGAGVEENWLSYHYI